MGIIRLLLAGIAGIVAIGATIPFVVVGAPFWIVSGLTRGIRWALRRWQPAEAKWTDLIEFVPGIGWKNRGGVHLYVRADRGARSFRVTTDMEGWRGAGTIEASDLIVFGDSFAFGQGVSDSAFFADRVSGLRVKALGVNGYNMVQELLWMERLRDRLRGKLVVWFVFYGNDLMDNLHPNVMRYRTPFVRRLGGGGGGEWEVVTDHVRSEPWPFDPRWGYSSKVAELCRPTFHSERAYSACAFLLKRGVEVCGAAGARLAVMGIPDVDMLDPVRVERLRRKAPEGAHFDVGLPDRRLGQMCGQMDIPFMALSEVIGVHDHIFDDCHWTPRGHARVARLLQDLYHGRARDTAVPSSARLSKPVDEDSLVSSEFHYG
jgi:hypothetical protein